MAGDVWSGLSRAALEAGFTKTTAHWESLREARIPTEGLPVHVFAIGQDRPYAIDAVGAVGDPGAPHLYGVIVAVPSEPSPLAGSLLYQGVEIVRPTAAMAGTGTRPSNRPLIARAVPSKRCIGLLDGLPPP